MPPALRTVVANGLRFAFLDEGSGPLVLCLHGFPDTAETWREAQPAIAAAGYRVVAPYLRGYAPTEAPPDGDYRALTLGRDVLALIAALGEERAVVVGHDWGAFAAYAAANLAPERIAKLVTVAIPHAGALRPSLRTLWRASHFFWFQLRKRAAARIRRDDFAEIEAIYRRWSPDWRPTAEDLAPVKRALAVPGGVEAALGYYWSFRAEAFSRAGAEARRLLRAKTAVPTLAFFGGSDGGLDPGLRARSPACFSGPYEMVLLDGVGHFLHREAPRQFIERTLAFLRA
jgi:pimeloyl-ACP methyl ester carboxylesterase